MVQVLCDTNVKGSGRYRPIKSPRFAKRLSKYQKKLTPKLQKAIKSTINMICNESDLQILQSRLSFHQLHNYTLTVDGVKYENPYDVHVPTGGSNSNNDMVILFCYNHDKRQVMLLDIGTHDNLNLNASTTIDNDLIWL